MQLLVVGLVQELLVARNLLREITKIHKCAVETYIPFTMTCVVLLLVAIRD